VRALVLWCPDWPVVAAVAAASTAGGPTGIEDADHIPVAVLSANRVVACSAAARAEGVRRGQRKREAQGRCPDLVTLPHDPAVAARTFEPVVAAIEAVAPGVEIIRPGLCAVRAQGPARYFQGEENAAARLAGTVLALGYECQAGVADGVFAAALAARQGFADRSFTDRVFTDPDAPGNIVPPDRTAEFLASFPVDTLDRPELADLLRRLGIRTLGAFAALPAADVLARFGEDGALAHQLAAGRGERPLAARKPPSDLTVRRDLDPPVNRVDTAAFHAKAAAEDLVAALTDRGLVATSVDIAAQTHDGGWLSRRWRHDGAMAATDIADRARWQIEGWLTGTAFSQPRHDQPFHDDLDPPQGLVVLRLEPVEAIPAGKFPTALWGGPGEHDERARRAVNRVHSLLGHGAVLVPVQSGGRSPADAIEVIPWGDQRTPSRSAEQPWPGRLPAPSPARVLPQLKSAIVLDATGKPVQVSERAVISAPPATIAVDATARQSVVGWAGPWPVDERWWDKRSARQCARVQVLTDAGAWLLIADEQGWWVEAGYD